MSHASVSATSIAPWAAICVTLLLAGAAAMWKLASTISTLQSNVNKEFTHNGGSSMKDHTRNAMESSKKAMVAAQDANERSERLENMVDTLSAALKKQHADNLRRLDALEATALANAGEIEQARKLAADASLAASRVQEQQQRNHDQLEEIVREIWQIITERLEHQDTLLRQQEEQIRFAYAALQELSVDVELPIPPFPHHPVRHPEIEPS